MLYVCIVLYLESGVIVPYNLEQEYALPLPNQEKKKQNMLSHYMLFLHILFFLGLVEKLVHSKEKGPMAEIEHGMTSTQVVK